MRAHFQIISKLSIKKKLGNLGVGSTVMFWDFAGWHANHQDQIYEYSMRSKILRYLHIQQIMQIAARYFKNLHKSCPLFQKFKY